MTVEALTRLRSCLSESDIAALGERARAARELGADPALVMHGGGNASLKLPFRHRSGHSEAALYVKASGRNMADLTEGDFIPLRLDILQGLAGSTILDADELGEELASARLVGGANRPSVESLLHAVLPHKAVDHTHPTSYLAISNVADGTDRLRRIFGDKVIVIPYAMPGVPLARAVEQAMAQLGTRATVGLALEHHGLVSFGDTVQESLERMLALVEMTTAYTCDVGILGTVGEVYGTAAEALEAIANLRSDISRCAGRSMLVTQRVGASVSEVLSHPSLAQACVRGPLTPDHVLYTKPRPMFGLDVAAYADWYTGYFEQHSAGAMPKPTMLDAAPRIILSDAVGLCGAGRTPAEIAIATDLFEATISAVRVAEVLGEYRPLSERDVYAVEYWDMERAKLDDADDPLTGRVAVVTGAASGIGRGCVDALLAQGAAVVGLDKDRRITEVPHDSRFLGLCTNVIDAGAVEEALACAVRTYGGVDILVLNAGIFPQSAAVVRVGASDWSTTFAVNVDANVALLRMAHPFLKLSFGGGRVVVVGSKNVRAPGRNAVAYSASKAALTQVARIAALEWASDAIRVNVVHPNAVFDTALWTDELLADRARSAGLSVDEYRTNTLLKTEVTSRDVGELIATLCGPVFSKVTGAQIPIDGGNERTI